MKDDVIRLVTSVCHITVKYFVAKQNVDCKRKDRMQKTIPPSTGCQSLRILWTGE